MTDLEILRRSAAMAPLTNDDLQAVLELAIRLQRERDQIVALLADLPASWSTVRAALNDIYKALGVGGSSFQRRD